MRKTFALQLSLRQIWSRANSTVVRLVSVLSMAGIAIGVASLVILQAFMGGFTEAIAQGLSRINPPLHIFVPGGETMDDFDLGAVQAVAGSVDGITGVVGIVERPAIVSGAPGTVSGAVVRGTGDSGSVILGRDLALELGVGPGDEIRIASAAGAEISGTGRVMVDTIAALTVDSVADLGLAEYNSSLVQVPLETARGIFRMGSGLTAAGGYISPGTDPVRAAGELDARLYDDYSGGGWPTYMSCLPFLAFHGNLFRALGLERTAMTIVLAMITVVALLNLSSALSMIAMEHRRDTGVLRAMGLRPWDVFTVSVLRGLILGGTGALGGLVFSLAAVEAVNRFFPVRLDGEVYWIDVLPGVFPAGAALVVTLATVVVCVAVAALSSVQPLKCSPSEALRYE